MDMEKKTGRKLGKTGAIGIALALVLLIALGVGGASGAFGLLKDTTAGVEAKYTPAEVVCAVTETTGEGTTTYSVTTDGSTTDAYLRAVIVMNWSNGDSIVYDPDKQFPEKYYEVLADMAINDAEGFASLAELAKSKLA